MNSWNCQFHISNARACVYNKVNFNYSSWRVCDSLLAGWELIILIVPDDMASSTGHKLQLDRYKTSIRKNFSQGAYCSSGTGRSGCKISILKDCQDLAGQRCDWAYPELVVVPSRRQGKMTSRGSFQPVLLWVCNLRSTGGDGRKRKNAVLWSCNFRVYFLFANLCAVNLRDFSCWKH